MFKLSTSLIVLHPNEQKSVALSLEAGHEEAFLHYLRALSLATGQQEAGSSRQMEKIAEVEVGYDEHKLQVPVLISREDIGLLLSLTKKEQQQVEKESRKSTSASKEKGRELLAHKPSPRSQVASSQHILQHVSQVVGNGNINGNATSRRCLYFRKAQVHFGSAAIGTMLRTRIELCNNTQQDLRVFLGDLAMPFVLNHSEVLIRAKSYVMLPVRFVPMLAKRDGYQGEMVAQSEDGQFTTAIALHGHAYA
jgi:hypothetical protein